MLRDAGGGVPVLVVDVHLDGLLGGVGFDKLRLGFVEPSLILEVHRVLEVNVPHLVASPGPRQLKGIVKLPGLARVVDRLLEQVKLAK